MADDVNKEVLEAEEKVNNPTEQELLKQIRDLLIENKELKKIKCK